MLSHKIVFTELWHCEMCGITEEEFSTADYMLIEPYFKENGIDPHDFIRDLDVDDPYCTYTHGSMITSEFWGTEQNERTLRSWFYDKYGKHLGLVYLDEPGEAIMCGPCGR